jgi:predicted ATP-grasp superfamily ATP-dependent carboligase
MEEIYEIKNMLESQFEDFNPVLTIELLKKAAEANVDINSLKKHAKMVKNWPEWKKDIELILNN